MAESFECSVNFLFSSLYSTRLGRVSGFYFSATLADAVTTSQAHLASSLTELNPLTAALLHNGSFLSNTLAACLLPTLFYIAFLPAWATVTEEKHREMLIDYLKVGGIAQFTVATNNLLQIHTSLSPKLLFIMTALTVSNAVTYYVTKHKYLYD